MGFSNDRANHSLEVAKQMYEKALEQTDDEFYARKMFHLGIVHDIGYQFSENTKDHPHAGGLFLKEDGYEFWEEVYEHGNPDVESPTKELMLLNWADMHTDGKGNRVSFEERLRDIKNRYGVDSVEYTNAQLVINRTKLIGGRKDEKNNHN